MDVSGIFEEAIADYLRKHGFTGLVHPKGECGCSLEEFAHCGDPELVLLCDLGHKHDTPNDPDGCESRTYPGKCDENCGFVQGQKFTEVVGEDDLVGLPEGPQTDRERIQDGLRGLGYAE
jgi:hypothetical protein